MRCRLRQLVTWGVRPFVWQRKVDSIRNARELYRMRVEQIDYYAPTIALADSKTNQAPGPFSYAAC